MSEDGLQRLWTLIRRPAHDSPDRPGLKVVLFDLDSDWFKSIYGRRVLREYRGEITPQVCSIEGAIEKLSDPSVSVRWHHLSCAGWRDGSENDANSALCVHYTLPRETGLRELLSQKYRWKRYSVVIPGVSYQRVDLLKQ